MDPSPNASTTASQTAELSNRGFLGWQTLALLGLATYVTLCSLLRFKRIQSVRARYGYTDRASLARMTNQDAHKIAENLIYLEFPLLYDLSMRLALFETYAVENIAKLLVTVSDLNKWDTLPKRYEDTEIIFSCFAAFPPTSTQLHKAIARMNFLHAPYIKTGKIRQEDLLYVLYASMAEPIRFLNIFEWRQLDEMEAAAIVTMWKYTGDMMDIDYRTVLQKDDWEDPLEFLKDVTEWASEYEDRYMRPVKEVQALGQILMEFLLQSHPKFARPVAYPMALVVIGNRLRRAFGFPEPSLAMTVLTYSLLLIRKLVIRFLCLPRIIPVEYISQPDKTTGRIKHYHYMKEPWYVPDTFWSRWNLETLLTWVCGGMIPGDGGADMKPDGFLFEDLGPKNKVGKGIQETLELEEMVRQRSSAGCPFAVATKP